MKALLIFAVLFVVTAFFPFSAQARIVKDVENHVKKTCPTTKLDVVKDSAFYNQVYWNCSPGQSVEIRGCKVPCLNTDSLTKCVTATQMMERVGCLLKDGKVKLDCFKVNVDESCPAETTEKYACSEFKVCTQAHEESHSNTNSKAGDKSTGPSPGVK